LNVLDLFSGIGGFSLGLESTGFFKTIAFVEKDEFCQKVLRKNFPNVPIEDEVRNVKGERFKADVITGGFPCQPFSVAGKRRGTEDDRFLWDETIRIVSEQKCKWFIGENVEGIINIQDGLVFRQIHDDLESEGFEVQSLVIPASGVGAWHQRKRVWIIGCNVSNANNARRKDWTQQHRRKQTQNEEGINSSSGSDIISHANNYGSHRSKGNETIESSNQSKEWLSVGDDKDVSNTESIRSRKPRNFNQEKRFETSSSTQFNGSSSNVSNTESELPDGCSSSSRNSKTKFSRVECNEGWNWNEVRSKTKRCSEQGKYQSWWETQSDILRNVDGLSAELDKDRTNRIKALGNSIVPQIAREIGKAIMEAELG